MTIRHQDRITQAAASSAYIMLSQGVCAAISVCFMAYFARVFTKDQMALYATLTIITSWNALSCNLGMGTLLMKSVTRLETESRVGEVRQLISATIIYRLFAILLATGAWWMASDYLSIRFFDNNSECRQYVRLVVITAVPVTLLMILTNVQASLQRFRSQSAVDIFTIITQRIFSLAGFYAAGIAGFFYGFMTGSLFACIVCIYDIRTSLTLNYQSFGTVFKDSREYMGLSFLQGAISQVDRPVVAFLLGGEALAGYHIAKRLYENMYSVVTAVVVPAGLKFGEVVVEGKNVLEEYYNKYFTSISYVFIPCGLYSIVMSGPIIMIYGGDKYYQDKNILMLFGFVIIMVTFWTLMREALLRLVHTYCLASQIITSSLVTFAGYFLFIPLIGVSAVPLSIGIGYLVGFLVGRYLIKKEININLPMRVFVQSLVPSLIVMCIAIPFHVINNHIITLLGSLIASSSCMILWTYYQGPNELRYIVLKLYNNIGNFCSWRKAVAGRTCGDEND